MPLPLIGLASLALEAGPAVIRGISSLFGGSDTAEKVADIVEGIDKLQLPKENAATAIENELRQLPPEAQVELKSLETELEKEITRRQQLALEDRQKAHYETQQTIREGDKATDEYVRRTRPKMARQSWYATVLYVVGFEAAQTCGYGTGADLDMAMILSAPAWAYLGLRTMDKTGALDKVKLTIKGGLNTLKGARA